MVAQGKTCLFIKPRKKYVDSSRRSLKVRREIRSILYLVQIESIKLLSKLLYITAQGISQNECLVFA